MTAEEILDRAAAASGSKAAYAKIQTMVTKATLTVPGMTEKGSILVQMKAPGKVRTEQRLKTVSVVQVFDGKRAYRKINTGKAEEITGTELEQLKPQAAADASVRWRQFYGKVELKGTQPVNGKPAYAVRLIPKGGGSPVMQYIDVKTFLPVRLDMVAATQQGSLPMQTFFSDYRAVSGVKIAYKTRVVTSTNEMTLEVTEVRVNVPLADSLFGKPS